MGDTLYCIGLHAGALYLARRESGHTAILDGWRPLGWDAHFHIAERLPGRMEQHIAGETENCFRRQQFDKDLFKLSM